MKAALQPLLTWLNHRPFKKLPGSRRSQFEALAQPALNALRTLKLTGRAAALAQQMEQPATQQLSFDERFAWLVQGETTYRENRRLQRLLQLARLRQNACVEEID